MRQTADEMDQMDRKMEETLEDFKKMNEDLSQMLEGDDWSELRGGPRKALG